MIRIEQLTKRYGAHTAVDSVSFAVTPGTVTGFLGPNGAGKSTTMRMLVGLTPPSSGSAVVLGVPYPSLPNPGRRVGVLLDASAQHPGRTGREVLSLGATLMGLPRSRVDEILDLVGLTDGESRRRVGDYSLGMRQRLGIGHALLGDPEVLILDEPANGLDPGGIHWMRGLLRRFADRGGSVLLSSHLLHEIEVIADELVIIGGGRIVAQGRKSAMLAGAGTVVRSPDIETLAGALTRAGLRHSTRSDAGLLVDGSIEDVGRAAAAAGAVLTELRAASGAGLEEMFLQLTTGAREEVPA
ncbi:MAG TPA: ATP-binding cassette domain-containing protein [Blastococcus sp.]|jgi:ABC-2 type transport system ATP-binding protein|nr:ATP-binding cassette domain-containing protein [Blastococcus sp.]